MRTAFYSRKPLKNLKYCIQRIKRGYCDADLWNIDCWFLGVIVPMLRQFSRTQMGWPGRLQSKITAEMGDGVDSNQLDEICQQKWKEILNKLADDFETLERMHYDIETKDKEREALKNKCFKTFSEYFFELWD